MLLYSSAADDNGSGGGRIDHPDNGHNGDAYVGLIFQIVTMMVMVIVGLIIQIGEEMN